jgi:TRAP-type C4-dicarboxylate transport system permease small subunit
MSGGFRVRTSIDRLVRFCEEACGVLALSIMFGAIIVQVVFRYLFTPLIWPFELSIFMYICLIYLGTALAARHDAHVAFDILFNLLSPRVQRVISLVLRLFAAAVVLTLVVPAARLMSQSHHIRSASLQIPWSFLVGVYLIGMLLMAGHLLAWALQDWKTIRGREG